jgi:hypothetical protein
VDVDVRVREKSFLMGIMTACHADPGLLAGDACAPSAAKPVGHP